MKCTHKISLHPLCTGLLNWPMLYISEVVCCVKSNMEKMKYNEEVHDHCTRQKSDLHTQFCRTTLFKNSSANISIKLYNKLPNTIKRLHKIQEFKRRLKYFLLQHIFYSVLLGSTITQLFIIMYTLFLVFGNSTERDTKKLYINVWLLIILYITVFH
jgi:hypothetical protein